MRALDEAQSPMAGIEVDFSGLSELVDTLRALAGELAWNGTLCGHVNDPDLADAIGRVERNWHKHRVTLQTFLDSATGSVVASLARYRGIESELARAAEGGR